MRVWVTRTQPGAQATADRVIALGHEPLVAPLLIVRNLPSAPSLVGCDALAFTSANAVRAFGGRGLDLPVFAVGAATACAARAAGYADVRAGPADVAALAPLIALTLPTGRRVLHPCAVETAGDLAGPLASAGHSLLAVPVYETVPTAGPSTLKALAEADAILLHSPRAARALVDLVTLGSGPEKRVLCLSHAVAVALSSIKIGRVYLAALPNDSALLNLL